MDSYPAATSWVLFGTIVGVGVWYYYPRQPQRPSKSREVTQPTVTGKKKRQEHDDRPKQDAATNSDLSKEVDARSTPVQASRKANGNDNLRKRKAESLKPAPTYAQVAQADEPGEDEMNNRKWAEGMMQTQKGYDITSKKGKEARVKTVKQNNASHASGEDDDWSPAVPPPLNSGDVSDMLEPTPSGPSTLRVTAPTKPQKESTVSRPKEEVVETKKQRQNRQKVEERRLQRAVEEEQRKKLQESQRRTAREARGEPAKNGIPLSQPPAVSAWSSSKSPSSATTATPVNGNQSAPLLDTFDAESLSSSNGGLEPSTGPTSTTSSRAAQVDHDLPSEEEQMAQAMKQSEDESGWMTVGQPKKPKKKAETPLAEPVLTQKTNIQPSNPASNGKPRGFQALDVQYEQRADADPNDASNWDA